MAVTVWVDGWQMQCCGEGFAAGGVVSWDLVRVDPEDYADVVGERWAPAIDFREEHHGQEPDRVAVSLEVLTIVEVHCRYETSPGMTAFPVPGTAVLVPVEAADGWAEVRPGVRFAGYLVTARLA
ncbi:DUF6578 domain-containing protein [Streptomyces sp. TLI_105]|uniref:DUF6578 domain-containing protein n=1 Tax=Streptomyces sp. TLI_105 TaxID=1881019 RepID=UPI000B84D209|nr:DUF6578 domain-containing protein [Streptomyces sp. TLI_105]